MIPLIHAYYQTRVCTSQVEVAEYEFPDSRVLSNSRVHEPRVRSARVRRTTRNSHACVIQSPGFELVCFLAECSTSEATF